VGNLNPPVLTEISFQLTKKQGFIEQRTFAS